MSAVPFALRAGSARGVLQVWVAALGLTVVAGVLAVWGTADLVRTHLLWRAVSSSQSASVGPVLITGVAAIFLAERFWPATARPATSKAHVVDAGYLGLYALLGPVVTVLNTGFALTVDRFARFMVLGRFGAVPRAVIVVAVLVGIDAMNWAAHVANHRSAALWRFHALHHSQEDMSVLTTFRTHPLTHASYLPALLPALVLVSSGTVPAVAFIGYGLFVALAHANLRWGYGPLGRVLVSPAFHRLHHARARLGDGPAVNYGFALTIWDRLAGCAVFGSSRATVPTGIAGRPVPVEQAQPGSGLARLYATQLAQPFRRQSGLEE